MFLKRLTLALALSGLAMSAGAANPPWTGTANYQASAGSSGDEDIVRQFSGYTIGQGASLLELQGISGTTVTYNGYYQSYVSSHYLASGTPPFYSLLPVSASGLDNTYEITAKATFVETVTPITLFSSAIAINPGGSFGLFLDTTTNRSFANDTGFGDGNALLSGTILGGHGTFYPWGTASAIYMTVRIDTYDSAVFSPHTISAGESTFIFQLSNANNTAFLSQIHHVMNQSYDPLAGDQLASATGKITLAVPEAETWAMMIAGLGLVGLQLRRRSRVSGQISTH